MLSECQRAEFDDLGWLRLPGALDAEMVDRLTGWVDELDDWAETGSPGLHHFEQTDHGPALARSEYFAHSHQGLGGFLSAGLVFDHLSVLFGEAPVLFKEKVNYKHPGGGGFAPHQDATAYRFVDHHISLMVPIDAATVDNGCLWFAPGHSEGAARLDEKGRIHPEVVAELDWRPIEVEPGDLVYFDSYAPHRSETNTTDRSRRALYVTYNAASKGDFRQTYYDDKIAEFDREGDSFDAERLRISVVDDFLGRPVAEGAR